MWTGNPWGVLALCSGTEYSYLRIAWFFQFFLLGLTGAEFNLKIILPHYCSKNILRLPNAVWILRFSSLFGGNRNYCWLCMRTEDLSPALPQPLGWFLLWPQVVSLNVSTYQCSALWTRGSWAPSLFMETSGLRLGALLHCGLETLFSHKAAVILGFTSCCFSSLGNHCTSLPDIQCYKNRCFSALSSICFRWEGPSFSLSAGSTYLPAFSF